MQSKTKKLKQKMKQLPRTLAFGAMVLLLITSTHVYGQTVNIPPDHNSAGTLNPPVSCDPDEPGEVLWTIVNNSSCDIKLTFTITIDGSNYQIVRTISSNGGESQITAQDVLDFLGELSEPVFISHSSLELSHSTNNTTIGYGYPNFSTRLYSSLPSPCDCIHMNWNQLTRQIILSNC